MPATFPQLPDDLAVPAGFTEIKIDPIELATWAPQLEFSCAGPNDTTLVAVVHPGDDVGIDSGWQVFRCFEAQRAGVASGVAPNTQAAKTAALRALQLWRDTVEPTFIRDPAQD